MKYLKLFEKDADYQAFIGGSNVDLPNVSFAIDTEKVYYHPFIDEGYDEDYDEGYNPQYLTFEALERGYFSCTNNGGGYQVQYSLDNGNTWDDFIDETPLVEQGSKVLIKSILDEGYDGSYDEGYDEGYNEGSGFYFNVQFYSNCKFNISGNIMSLLYGDDFENKTDLFNQPSIFLNMFNGCDKLIDASKLILPATTLVDFCYESMFQDCTSLVTAPELPATTLAEACYFRMFQGCTSLTTAPELPATTLARTCYRGMFNGCTSLTTAPELPATTLANYCYAYMFDECTSLNNITMLATDTSASYCLDSWVNHVASTGTFTKAASMTSLPNGKSGIPNGWTVVNYAE